MIENWDMKFQRGRHDAKAGKLITDNPYQKGDDSHGIWVRGFEFQQLVDSGKKDLQEELTKVRAEIKEVENKSATALKAAEAKLASLLANDALEKRTRPPEPLPEEIPPASPPPAAP